MTLRSLFLVVGVALASTPIGAQQCPPHFSASAPCADERSFRVCALEAFDPGQFNPASVADADYKSPSCSTLLSITYPQRLIDVYGLIHPTRPDVTDKLCQLRSIFITPDHTFTNLGVWEFPGRPTQSVRPRGNGKVYIVLRESTLTATQSLADEENALIANLLGIPSSLQAAGLPYFTDTNTNSERAATLAILAHELGHLLLAETNADGTGASGHAHPRPCPAPQPDHACFESSFLGAGRWDATTFHNNLRRWIPFGGQKLNTYLNPNGNLNMASPTPAALAAIYNTREFVSLLAAHSPEEDFVESYKYKILAQAGLNLTLNIPGSTPIEWLQGVVLPATQSGATGVLHDKLSCVAGLTE